ncbi:MAG: polyhydroxyalkanoic acid system family protein [Polyangiaceae bacterium]
MASIDINRSHSLGLDEAKARAEQLAQNLKSKMGLAYSWDADCIRFKGDTGPAKGVKGTVSVSASTIRVEIDLPFLMKAMKGPIASKVNAKLDHLFA